MLSTHRRGVEEGTAMPGTLRYEALALPTHRPRPAPQPIDTAPSPNRRSRQDAGRDHRRSPPGTRRRHRRDPGRIASSRRTVSARQPPYVRGNGRKPRNDSAPRKIGRSLSAAVRTVHDRRNRQRAPTSGWQHPQRTRCVNLLDRATERPKAARIRRIDTRCALR